MKTYPDRTKAQRQALYRSRMKERGYVSVQTWVPANRVEYLRKYAETLARHYEEELAAEAKRAGKTGK